MLVYKITYNMSIKPNMDRQHLIVSVVWKVLIKK